MDFIKVSVTARNAAGFRRAGKFWDSTPTIAEVTSDELAILRGEMQLVVLELDEEGNAVGGAVPDVALEAKLAALETDKAALKTANQGLKMDVVALSGEKATLEAKLAALETDKTALEKPKK